MFLSAALTIERKGRELRLGIQLFLDFLVTSIFSERRVFLFIIINDKYFSKGVYVMTIITGYQSYFFNYISIKSSAAQCLLLYHKHTL